MQFRSDIKKVSFFFVAFLGVHVAITQHRPLNAYKNLATSRTLFDVPFSFDPASTVLVVIDFWDDVAPPEYINRTISLIELMRSNEVSVVFISHEFPTSSELVLTEKDVVLDGYTTTLESFFSTDSLDIKTILYAGYHTAECLIITRLNSISRLSWRTNEFDIVVVKDCTWSGYWHYTWAMNAIETKFLSTDLQSLYVSLDPDYTHRPGSPGGRLSFHSDAGFSNAYYEDYKKRYRCFEHLRKDKDKQDSNKREDFDRGEFISYDTAFGKDEDWTKYSLVILNAVSNHPDSTWQNRAINNNQKKLKPLVGFARDNGIPVSYFMNGQEMDSIFEPATNEGVFDDADSLLRHLKSTGATKLLLAGNLTSFFDELTPLDAWRFTVFNGGFETVFLEDCIIADEIEETEEYEIFKFVFLERAIFYRETYRVSTSEILSRNVFDISLNETYLDSDTLYVEIYNRSSLPIYLGDFRLRLNGTGPMYDLPIHTLEPQSFFTFQTLTTAADGVFEESEATYVYLLSSTARQLVVDSIPYVRNWSIGKFPNGGQIIVEYHNVSLGGTNYFLTQDRFLCEDSGPVELSVNGGEGFDYAWYLNDVQLADKEASIITSDPGIYKVVVSFNDTTIESELQVEKIPLPEAEVYMDYNTSGSFGVLSLPALRTDSLGQFSYTWVKDDVVVGTDYRFQAQVSGIYSVFVQSDKGCVKESGRIELMIDHHHSLRDTPGIISVSPNPTAGQFTLYLASDPNIQNITLYNIHGSRLFIKRTDAFGNVRSLLYNSSKGLSLDFDVNLENGVYFLVVDWEDGHRDRKRIVVSK